MVVFNDYAKMRSSHTKNIELVQLIKPILSLVRDFISYFT